MDPDSHFSASSSPVSECIDKFTGAATGVSSSGERKLDDSKKRMLFYNSRVNKVATVQEQLRERHGRQREDSPTHRRDSTQFRR